MPAPTPLEGVIDTTLEAILAGDVSTLEADRFSPLYCGARDAFHIAYRPIVRVHFADLFGVCPGAGEF